jgi:GNAT superfamily N-acetyltransferase
MRAPLPPPLRRVEALLPVRPLSDGDAEALAVLMHAAYLGGVDDDAQTPEAARCEVAQAVRGDYGALLRPASLVAEAPGALAAALVVTRWNGAPLVAFVMTAPAHQRRGLARALLLHAMKQLADAGERELLLIVTRGNSRAERLYEQLGFVDVDPSRVTPGEHHVPRPNP